MEKPKLKLLKLNKFSVVKAAEYPDDWKFIPLGGSSSGTFSNGVNNDKEDYGEGCLFVNISDVFREFTIDPRKLGRVKLTEDQIKQYKLKKEDLVLDRSSNIFETVGWPAYFDGFDEPVVFSGFTFRYRPNNNQWNSKFLTYQLMSYPIRKLVTAITTQSANSNVNQQSYKKICVPSPPKNEQKSIVNQLLNVDKLIFQTNKIVAQTRLLKKGLMQKLLTKGIGHAKFKKIKWYFQKEISIPEKWDVKLLSELGELSAGATPSTKEKKFWENGTIPWLQSGEIDNNRITSAEKKITKLGLQAISSRLFRKNTVVIAITGFGDVRGKTSLLEIDTSANQSVVGVVPNHTIDSEYLWYYLQYRYELLRNFAQGTQQPGLPMDILEKFYIIYPKLKQEQRNIVLLLSMIDSRIQNTKKYNSKLKTLKRGLTQKLLTGQVRVKV